MDRRSGCWPNRESSSRRPSAACPFSGHRGSSSSASRLPDEAWATPCGSARRRDGSGVDEEAVEVFERVERVVDEAGRLLGRGEGERAPPRLEVLSLIHISEPTRL